MGGFYFFCGNCEKRVRHTGKNSELSRAKKIKCPECGSLSQVEKKSNGKIVIRLKKQKFGKFEKGGTNGWGKIRKINSA